MGCPAKLRLACRSFDIAGVYMSWRMVTISACYIPCSSNRIPEGMPILGGGAEAGLSWITTGAKST